MVWSYVYASFLALQPTSIEAPEREYGAVMGDGLRLTAESDPLGGGICADGETQFGIDVSYYQGDIDWNAVAGDGVKFALVRVSHSTQFFDPQFDANLAGSRAAGIHTGVYQYFEPDEDPIAQADLLLEHLGPLQPGDLPPMIDVESTGGQSPAAVASAVRAWVDHVEAALGVRPLIYTGYYFWQDNVSSPDFGDYPLWIAWYGVDCPGNIPTGWSQWAFHQYCDCGSVAGISGNVDVNRFNGTLADLEALGAAPEPCGYIGADGGTIDNGDACYRLFGNSMYWREEPMGEGGSLVWTNATDYAEPSNYARWELYFEEAGLYDVEVNVVQPFGESTQAGYVIRHAEGEDTVLVDQSSYDGWVSLGAFSFGVDEAYAIELADNTGESIDGEISIVYDAVRITPVGVGGESSGGSADESSGGGEASSGGPDETSGTGGTTGETNGSSEDGGGPALPPESGESEGCGCRSSGSGSAGWLLFGLLGLLRRRGKVAVLLSATACGAAEQESAETDVSAETSSGQPEPDMTSSSSTTGSEAEGTDTAAESSTSGAGGSTSTDGESSSSSSGGPALACATVRVMIAPGATLNLRPDASTANDPVGTLANADIVEVLEEVEGQSIEDDTTWLHVASADQDGYIARAHTSCAVDECDLFEVPEADYLTYGLHPDASDALVFLGITPDRVTQTIGSAAASAGTHAQDGTADGTPYSAATDLRVIGLSDADVRQYIIDLAAAGYAGWYRKPGEDGVPSDWSPHIHTVWVGAPMKASLRNQVRSWMEGRNGLVSNTPYAFHQWPQCVRDALWERYLEHNPAQG